MRNPYELLPPERKADMRLARDFAWACWDRWLYLKIRWTFSDEPPEVTGTLTFGDGGEMVITGATCIAVTQAFAARTGNFHDGYHSNPTYH
jgi:hypothetical protein